MEGLARISNPRSLNRGYVDRLITEFSLEDTDGGGTDVRTFDGLYWMCDWGGVSGPLACLDEAADAVFAMAVD